MSKNADHLFEMPPHYVVFDVSNLLHRTFYANKTLDDMTTAGLAHHQALLTLNKYYKLIKPTKVIMTFDRPNWRKDYTKSSLCISQKVYKGNRRQDLTAAQQLRYDMFCEHLKEFEEIMRKHTGVICLASKGLEADDLMAGVVQKYKDEARVTMVSADKDLMQLLTNENVRLIDPASGDDRTLEDHDNDPEYFMFEKCLRGDRGDNVQSAFPRVHKTKIKEAYKDPYQREKMMNHEWVNVDKRKMKVKDLFEENKLLMDLSYQPEPIRELIDEVIEKEFADPGTFSYFHFIRFCGKYELKRITDSIEHYTPMLNN